MSNLIKPNDYKALLDPRLTEQGIKLIKEFFQQNLSTELRLRRVTAPLFVLKGLGINDDLNGVERPVTFPIKDLGDAKAEVVHSLAKWKRLTLAEYDIEPGYGIYIKDSVPLNRSDARAYEYLGVTDVKKAKKDDPDLDRKIRDFM